MAKTKTLFVCTGCGNEFPKWMGKCAGCGEWNTLVEEVKMTGKAAKGVSEIITSGSTRAKSLDDIGDELYSAFSSGIPELDRVFGGKGIVRGSVTLIAGEPGKGKSTLLSQVADYVANNTGIVLYSSGEESEGQGKKRFVERMKLNPKNLRLLNTRDIEIVERNVDELKPALLIIDSIQMLGDPSIPSAAGSVSQIDVCAARLIHLAKSMGTAVILVGQVLKDNSIAGPKRLEHMVDTVLYLEGEKYNDFRLVRVHKNRFGSANELGVFQMREEGMVEITNPSEYLLSSRGFGVSGSSVVCVSDARPILLEVQALVSPPVFANATPRRTSEGFSRNRLNIIIAVLEKRLGQHLLGSKDIYVNVVGGMEIEEPSADLGVAMAIYSSDVDRPVDGTENSKTLVLGEIGLTGEIRPVANVEQLVAEAEKVGFTDCVLPRKNFEQVGKKARKMKLLPVDSINDAIRLVFGGA